MVSTRRPQVLEINANRDITMVCLMTNSHLLLDMQASIAGLYDFLPHSQASVPPLWLMVKPFQMKSKSMIAAD